MKPLAISGIGVAGAFGCGRAALEAALTGAAVEPQQVDVRGVSLPAYRADVAPLAQHMNKRALRRIDHCCRLALLGACEALADAGQPEFDPARVGVIVGTGFGAMATSLAFLDSVRIDGDMLASPTAFSNSVHNAAVAYITMSLKFSGPGLTVSQFDMSYISALLAASQWLDEGRVDAVLYGVVDEYSETLGYCWRHYSGGMVASRLEPLELDRQTAIAGEGAAFLLLEPAKAGDPRPQLQMLQMGSRIDLPAEGPLLLACDGFVQTGRHYAELLASGRQTACCTHLYGSSPVAPAFDLAVAALALDRPGLIGLDGGNLEAIHCLRYGFSGEGGHVQIGR